MTKSHLRPRAALCSVICATVFLAPSIACSQSGARVLDRDPTTGGPAGVAIGDLGPLFEDSDINQALVALDGGSAGAAIEVLSDFRAANPESDLADEALFAHGYALYVGGQHADALAVFADCPDQAPLYTDYCLYWAADAALLSGDPSAAEAFAAAVDSDAVFGPRARVLRARALAEAGDHRRAITVFEEFLADYPTAYYRNDVEMALGASYEASGDFDEAARIYRRIAIVNPGRDAETRALSAIESIEPELDPAFVASLDDRTNAETLERSRSLFDRHRSDEVIGLLEPVVAAEAPGSAVYCEAAYLVGKSYSKLRQHGDSLGPYAAVIDHCSDQDLVVKALYNAGRGAWNIDDDQGALDYFERLWTEYSNNSYADDAVLLAARVHRGNDQEAEYVALLEQQIRDFPDGDMLNDAVWLLASRLYTEGDYRELVQFVDELGSRTGENDIYSRGRLGYYRARSLEMLSLSAEAKAGYAAVVRDNPMAFYALLAWNRLRDIDEARAAALMSEVTQTADGGEGAGMIAIRPPEAAHDPYFLRATALLRMGLHSLAEPEFAKLRANYANEDEIGWVVSLLYHHAGAFERSHHVPGERLDLNLGYPTEANLERWRVAYPTPFEEQVADAAEERELDRYWVYAIMREESGFRPEIESWANARGLLQLMEGTANDMARLTGRGSVRTSQLFDPEINIELGVMFMRTLADRFASHPCLVFAGYNGGHGNVNSWLRSRGDLPLDLWVEEIPYAQTRNYVKRVTMTWWVYHWLDDEQLPDLGWDLTGL